MKRIVFVVLLFILIAGGGWVYYSYFFGENSLSPDQQELVDTFGYPQRFVISYVQYAEEGDNLLVRHETWYYSEHQQSITFIGGDIVETAEIDEEVSTDGEITYGTYKPEDFEFAMDYDAVAGVIGGTIEPNDFSDEFFTDSVQNYVADHAFFTIEDGHLTYFEMVGVELEKEES